MRERYIFWEQPLQLTGNRPPDIVASGLTASLSSGRFRGGDRLSGTVEGRRFRVWQKSGIAADSVECVGAIAAAGQGSVIEGTLRYKRATRIQFAGGFLLGVILAAIGLMQRVSGPESPFAPVGLFILGVTLVWIYSSAKMKDEQIRFIREKLQAVVSD